ncbi:MAG: hypothetical protein WCY62_05565 [Clostridia bacterium]
MLILLSLTACKPAAIADNELMVGTYNTSDGFASVKLEKDGKFIFCRNIATSYWPSGNYEITGSSLVLTASEDEIYGFSISDNSIIFQSGTAAEGFMAIGTVFTYDPEFTKSYGGTKTGVEEFLLLIPDHVSTYKNDACYNITPECISDTTEYVVFKFDQSCESFLLYKGKVYEMGLSFGGYGVIDMVTSDLNKDLQEELYFTYSWGSGIHRSLAGCFDPATEKILLPDFANMDMDMMLIASGNDLYLYNTKIVLTDFVNYKLYSQGYTAMITFDVNSVSVQPAD